MINQKAINICLRLLVLLLITVACSSQPAEAQTVYITKSGEKYHRESCQYLRKSKIATTLADAKVRGYIPCSVCKPSNTSGAKSGAEKNSNPPAGPNGRSKPTESQPDVANPAAVQCLATTKAGTRCKRTTSNANGRCYQHQ